MSRQKPNPRQSIDPDFEMVLANLGEGASWETFASEQRALLMTLEENNLESARLAGEAADEAFARALSADLNSLPPTAAAATAANHQTPRRRRLSPVEDDEPYSDANVDYSDEIETETDTNDEEYDDDDTWDDVSADEEEDTYEDLLDLAARLGDVPRQPRIANIDCLPTRVYPTPPRKNGKSTSPECSICLSQFRKNAVLRRLPCLHEFHKTCIDQWLKRNNLCPVCRMEV